MKDRNWQVTERCGDMKNKENNKGNIGKNCFKCNPVVGKYHDNNLTIDVIISDTREVWGRTDYLITPVSGSGDKWVSDYKISIDKD